MIRKAASVNKRCSPGFQTNQTHADLANTSPGWQWTAGCGADAAPYFRIFNPTRQSERFDGSGQYIRRWVPELRHLPDTVIHEPWEAMDRPHDDPAPMVNHNKPATASWTPSPT